ncbi:hypothetical protein OAZ97_00730 [Prochlorococcus sp. AH-736-E15]|nr:hypothetical protein [Prochlorococcus sp. AH-736-E15]
MNEKLNSNNIENDESTRSTLDTEYKILLNKLSEIKTTIALLKNIFR